MMFQGRGKLETVGRVPSNEKEDGLDSRPKKGSKSFCGVEGGVRVVEGRDC